MAYNDDDIIWGSGTTTDVLWLLSGRVTSTVKESQTISVGTLLGLSSDTISSDTLVSDASILYVFSGQFTSTIKTSQGISDARGVSSDDDRNSASALNIPGDKLIYISGIFSD